MSIMVGSELKLKMYLHGEICDNEPNLSDIWAFGQCFLLCDIHMPVLAAGDRQIYRKVLTSSFRHTNSITIQLVKINLWLSMILQNCLDNIVFQKKIHFGFDEFVKVFYQWYELETIDKKRGFA